ncbi:MAG TPA: hypothetical protein VGN22_08605 [Pseudonocardia sp.]|jgi:hypothetical protein
MGGDGEEGGRRRRRWPLVVLTLSALAVGLVAGFLLRPLVEPAPVPPAPPVAVPTSPAPPRAGSTPCEAVAQDGRGLLVQLERAVAAIAALDPAALRQVVDEVQRLQAHLEREVDACDAGPGSGEGPR